MNIHNIEVEEVDTASNNGVMLHEKWNLAVGKGWPLEYKDIAIKAQQADIVKLWSHSWVSKNISIRVSRPTFPWLDANFMQIIQRSILYGIFNKHPQLYPSINSLLLTVHTTGSLRLTADINFW